MRIRHAFGLFLAVAIGATAADVKDVHRTVPLAANGQLTIDTYKGSVRVTTWDKNEVEIHARIEPDDSLISDSRDVRDTEIRIDASSSSVRVKTDYSRVEKWFQFNQTRPRVRYTVSMPRTASLVIKDYKSETEVVGLRADLDIHTYRGKVNVKDLDGSIQAYTYRGEMKIERTNLRSRSKLDTYRGEYDVTLSRSTKFDIDEDQGGRGRLDSDFPRMIRSLWESRHRSQVNGGGPVLLLKSYRGTFRLRAR